MDSGLGRSPFRILHWLAAAFGVVIIVFVPLGYYLVSHHYVEGALESEAEINARILSQIISQNPAMWQYEKVRIEEYLSKRPTAHQPESRRVIDRSGTVVLERSDTLREPTLTRTCDLFDSGVVVGRIEVARSLRPLLQKSLWLALGMLPLGAGAILSLGVVPIRAIRRQVREALGRERDTAQQYLDIAGVMLVALDSRQRITMINRKGCQILDYSPAELRDRNWLECCVPEDARDEAREQFLALSRSAPGTEMRLESSVLTKQGLRKTILWHHIVLPGAPGGVSGTLSSGEDITERMRLEAQLRHAQKMDAIGKLAGGVAHDFNNILSVIMGYCGMMRMQSAEDDPQRLAIDQILAATERASKLTNSLLLFSRKEAISPQNADLNAIISTVGKFLQRIIGEDIELRLVLNPEPLEICVDVGQIEQVLMNLSTNARDAMGKGGTLIVETSIRKMSADFIRAHGYGAVGTFALLTVSDSGSGIDATTLKQVFEPFFTTKEAGKGTGLGLSIVYGIVKQHGGFINCYSEPGQGTVFKLYFPLAKPVCRIEPESPTPAPLVGGSETILVVEDDASVRMLVASVLEEFGYRVLHAEDGQAALETLASREAVHLVLMDIVMPKMNGRIAAERIRARRPEQKMLFTSGYTSEFLSSRGLLGGDLELLAKPYQPEELLAKIRAILDRG